MWELVSVMDLAYPLRRLFSFSLLLYFFVFCPFPKSIGLCQMVWVVEVGWWWVAVDLCRWGGCVGIVIE